MKKHIIMFVTSVALVAFAACKKDSGTCHTCSLPCETAGIYTSSNDTYVTSTSFCGPTAAITAWETGVRAQYSTYYVVFNSSAAQAAYSQQVCGTPDQTNAAIATYTTTGYTCN